MDDEESYLSTNQNRLSLNYGYGGKSKSPRQSNATQMKLSSVSQMRWVIIYEPLNFWTRIRNLGKKWGRWNFQNFYLGPWTLVVVPWYDSCSWIYLLRYLNVGNWSSSEDSELSDCDDCVSSGGSRRNDFLKFWKEKLKKEQPHRICVL